MNSYPDRHHPCFFLEDALTALGAQAQVVRNEQTLGCWGLMVNGKRMVWLIDNRHPHEALTEDPAARQLLTEDVLVCHAQLLDAERVGGKWLPLAVTPGYCTPDKPVEKLYDVAFVGYVRDSARAEILRHVARHFSLCVEQGAFGDNAVSAYWSARVGLNIPTGYGQADAYDSANMRCFEILATGTPLVTEFQLYLFELGLTPAENYESYSSPDDLLRAVEQFVRRPKLAEEVGNAGAKLAQERHTYEARAKQVLAWLE